MIVARFVVVCALLLSLPSVSSAQVPSVTPTPGDSPLVSISLVPDVTKDKKISVGEFANFTATGHYQNGAEKNLTQKVNYTSSDPTVAEAPNTPGNKGRVDGIKPGVVTITATDPDTNISSDDTGGVNGHLTVEGALVSITLKPLDKNAEVGDNVQYTAIGQLSDGNTRNMTQKVVYSSSNTSVAVCPNTDGNKSLVQAVGVGTTTISATDPVTEITTEADGRSTLTVRAAGSSPGAGTPTPRTTPTVCGDPDATGTVTVSDGVQVLSAAAGLPSGCSELVCDVDNSGTVTVTDGVLVLRNAAGLDDGLHCQ